MGDFIIPAVELTLIDDAEAYRRAAALRSVSAMSFRVRLELGKL